MTQTNPLLVDFITLINQVISIEVDNATINENTGIVDDLMIDSISLVSLIALTEERFGIDLASRGDAIANIRTVGDALALVSGALNVDALTVGG